MELIQMHSGPGYLVQHGARREKIAALSLAVLILPVIEKT
jgi:hypothetical protein